MFRTTLGNLFVFWDVLFYSLVNFSATNSFNHQENNVRFKLILSLPDLLRAKFYVAIIKDLNQSRK